VRGYLLTGSVDYLQPYQEGKELTTQSLDELTRMTRDNLQQQDTLQQMRPLVRSKLQWIEHTVAVHDTQNAQAAVDLVTQSIGKGLMDQIHELTQLMQQRERGLLALRTAKREASSLRSEILIIAGLAAYLLLLLGAFITIRNALAQRRIAEMAAFRARELAEVTLHSIGDGVLITDVNGIVTGVNAAAIEIIAGSNDSPLGLHVDQVLKFLNRHTRDIVPNPIFAALAQKRTIELEPDAILIRKDGSEIGVEDSAAPIHDQSGVVVGCVLVFRDVTERRSLVDKIATLALYDGLTGLANRSLLEDRLQKAIELAIRQGDKVGLVFMDLDHFKRVNDTLGHPAGDALLKEVAARLAGSLRASDTACRVGGDEFIALLPSLASTDAAKQVVERIYAAAAERPVPIAGQEVPIRFSAGVAVYPDDAKDGNELIRKADARMYAAKTSGRESA
jgi:diguanylate cyclase (GGDEF)-like protein/PAS domain S-box-containing protein